MKKQTDILVLTIAQLKKLFCRQFPALADLAKESGTIEKFRENLENYIARHPHHDSNAASALRRLIKSDGTSVHELSTEKDLEIRTITLLWKWLRGTLNGAPGDAINTDFILELYHQFELLEKPEVLKPTETKVINWMRKWKSGLSPRLVHIREENKERIIRILMAKIENKHSGKYVFPEGSTYMAKFSMVEKWWNDYHFQLAMAARNPSDVNLLLNNSLSEETMTLLKEARRKGIPTFATPYYLSLLDVSNQAFNDLAIRNYVIYSKELVNTFLNIVAWEREDQVEPGTPNAAGWLLPNHNNIHRRYPDVAILIPDSIGRSCGGLCAPCQRMYDFQNQHLNFELEQLKPHVTWNKKLRRLMHYFEKDTQLRDILITGGMPS